MSKKKKPSTTAKSKAGHPARSAASAKIVSIDEFRARTAGDDLSPRFMKWLRVNAPLLANDKTLPTLQTYLELYSQEVGDQDFTIQRWSSMKSAILRFAAEIEDRDFEYTLQIVMGYLLFLGDSGLWSGTDEQFDQAQELVLELLDVQSDEDFDEGIFEVPALTFDQKRDALLALPLAKHLQAFLAWFGSARDITSTGILTRKDIEGAAAALGMSAIGVNSAPSLVAPEAGEPVRVTSAKDLPRLHMFWDALIQVGIISLSAKRASVNDLFEHDPQIDTDQRWMHLTKDMALAIYEGLIDVEFEDEDDDDLSEEEFEDHDVVGMWMSTLLLEAGMDEGYPADSLENALSTLEGSDQKDLLVARELLHTLAQEGLIETGSHYRIPPVLKKIIAHVIAEPSSVEVDYEDELDEDLGYLGATS